MSQPPVAKTVVIDGLNIELAADTNFRAIDGLIIEILPEAVSAPDKTTTVPEKGTRIIDGLPIEIPQEAGADVPKPTIKTDDKPKDDKLKSNEPANPAVVDGKDKPADPLSDKFKDKPTDKSSTGGKYPEDSRSRVELDPEAAARYFCRDVLNSGVKHGDKSSRAFAVYASRQELWRESALDIRYGFVDGSYKGTAIQQKKVQDAIDEWTWYANVTFTKVDISSAQVKIAFDTHRDAGSWSLVGNNCVRSKAGTATMNLGWVDDGAIEPKLTKQERAVILHEFGHVLGMLHEHQSPAGGGVPIAREAAAIEFYGREDDWNETTVREQVLTHYNVNDVTSFSEVDRFSIMQYPMPARVTGLAYDIDYNYALSDLDKAYMCIMYPRPKGQTHAKAPEWTFEYALAKSGIVREAPDKYKKISQAYSNLQVDSDARLDPSEVRQIFLSWCSEAHAAKEQYMRQVAPGRDEVRGKKPTDDERGDASIDRNTFVSSPMDFCATTDEVSVDEPAPEGATRALLPGQARAVNQKPAWFDRKFPFKPADDVPNFERKITWRIDPCPSPPWLFYQSVESATAYQGLIFQKALHDWALYASVRFVEAKPEDKAVDMIVMFQSKGYTSKEVLKNHGKKRSYCYVGDDKHYSTTYLPEDPPAPHNICYRGISLDEDESKKPAVNKILEDGLAYEEKAVTNGDWDMRTLRHELGHYLGLDHEFVGAYGWLIFNSDFDGSKSSEWEDKLKNIRRELRATKYDTGSIMDSLRPAPVLTHLRTRYTDIREGLRTVFNLSQYDAANIALSHPGERLHGDAGQAVIKIYGDALRLGPDDIQILQGFAKSSSWSDFRIHYRAVLGHQTNIDLNISNKVFDVAQQIAREKDKALRAPNAPLRAAQPKLQIGAKDPLLRILYDRLSKTIGPTGAQVLSLQVPTRYLAKDEFQFELSGIYSNFIKPVVVAEAEFRLTDALYDAAPIVSAPNGRSLSTVYHQILNNLVPKYTDSDRKVREERERIRSWLLTEVGTQDPYYKYEFNTAGGGMGDHAATLDRLNDQLVTTKNSFVRKMTRMEFASQLTQDYYDAQMKWELDRDALIEDAITTRDPKKLNQVTRQLVHTTQAAQGKLNMHYANSVVRGYSHNVREALGHLDVATPAESLQDAKDAFRSTAVSSLYGGSRVYPVLMGPVDWATALDTGFTPEDLAETPDVIIMVIKSKSANADVLRKQLAALQGSGSGDPTELKKEVEKSARELEDADAKLRSKYTESAIELAKVVIAIGTAIATEGASIAAEEAAASAKQLTDAKADLKKNVDGPDPDKEVETILNQVKEVGTAQRNLQSATSAWNSKKLALARAEATDTKTDQTFLESSIAALDLELADLNARLQAAQKVKRANAALANSAAVRARPGGKGLTVEDLVANKPQSTVGGSRWQEISIAYEHKEQVQETGTEASAASSRWNVDFWIGSAGGSNESSTSSFRATNQQSSVNVTIAMKVTLVTVDRSSWFQPNVFDNSKGFMKNNEGMSFTEYAELIKKDDNNKTYNVTAARAAAEFRNSQDEKDLPNGLLPTFPVGYILCKDVVIKVSGLSLSTSEDKAHLAEKAQSSGGCFCFSYNQASEHTKDSSRAAFEFANDGMIVRIPGPQILGYVQQVMPPDATTPYETKLSLGQDFYLPEEASPAFAKNPPKPSHGAAPPGQRSYDDGGQPVPLFTIPDAKSSKSDGTVEDRTLANKDDGAKSEPMKTAKPLTKDPITGKPVSNDVAPAKGLPNGVDPLKTPIEDEQAIKSDHMLFLLLQKLRAKDEKALQELLEKI